MAGRYEPRPPGTDDHDRMIGVEQMLCDALNELLGNGQPGRLAKMDSRIDHGESRISKVEHRMWFWGGGLAVLAFLAGIVAKVL